MEVARVQRGRLQVTVDEEGRTRVRDRFVIAAPAMRFRSKRWQREMIVASTLCGSVVARTKMMCGGGSSSVLSRAFQAGSVSMWTSSMMKTL